MRSALARRPQRRAAERPNWGAQETFVPAPSQGWDTETPVAELPPTRARVLDNWLPSGVQLKVRNGYAEHVTGITGPVETLMAYNAGSNSTLFAAAGANIYDVTSSGAVGAASLGSMSTARNSWINFTTSGGSFLWICNGVDNPRHWNGSVWATPSLTVTTFTDNDIAYVHGFKERLFFVFKNSLTLGYLPIQSIAGTVSNLPLGAVFNFGGRVLALGSLSRDGGSGVDDYLCVLTSQGEIAVFAGTNPADATAWALVGVYYVGDPIGDRPFVNIGGDLGVITRNGLISVNQVMAGATEQANAHIISAIISTAFREAAVRGAGFTGWEAISIPEQDLLIVNAPATAETANQFVRHRVTTGWSRFTGWNFETFEIFNSNCYAGGSDGTVYLCFNGNDDNGADITAAFSGPWTTLGAPVLKTLMEIRPIVTTATRAVLRLVARTDFRQAPPLPAWPVGTVTNALIWGSGIWGTNLWGGEDATTRQWRAISGEGHSVSIVAEARSNQSEFTLNGFQLRYTVGGQV